MNMGVAKWHQLRGAWRNLRGQGRSMSRISKGKGQVGMASLLRKTESGLVQLFGRWSQLVAAFIFWPWQFYLVTEGGELRVCCCSRFCLKINPWLLSRFRLKIVRLLISTIHLASIWLRPLKTTTGG